MDCKCSIDRISNEKTLERRPTGFNSCMMLDSGARDPKNRQLTGMRGLLKLKKLLVVVRNY
jgi:hypothetical protein